jgi:hypothetical protein
METPNLVPEVDNAQQPELPGIASMLEAKDPEVEVVVEPAEEDAAPLVVDAPSAVEKTADENLRVMLREMKKQNAVLAEQVNNLKKAATSEEGTVDLSAPGEIENLQNEIAQIGEKNAVAYETLVETMALNPAFQDVREVCSRDNLDDIIEAATANIVAKDGGNPVLIALELEKQIWNERNPYKAMYSLIKQYHPKYQQAAAATVPAQKKELKPVQAPSSIASLGGGDGDKSSGWTSARIDAMDEMKLSTVPKDIYEQYLMGTLN